MSKRSSCPICGDGWDTVPSKGTIRWGTQAFAIVARASGHTVAALRSRRRFHDHIIARAAASFVMYELGDLSFPRVAEVANLTFHPVHNSQRHWDEPNVKAIVRKAMPALKKAGLL